MPARDGGFHRLHQRVGRGRLVDRMAERQVDDVDAVGRLVGDRPLRWRSMTLLVTPEPWLSSTRRLTYETPGATPLIPAGCCR